MFQSPHLSAIFVLYLGEVKGSANRRGRASGYGGGCGHGRLCTHANTNQSGQSKNYLLVNRRRKRINGRNITFGSSIGGRGAGKVSNYIHYKNKL